MSRRFELAAHEALRRRRTNLRKLRALHLSIEDELLGSRDPDIVDRASRAGDGDCFLKLSEVEYDELVGIEAAMDRIVAGDYGTCARCANKIGPRRLETLPATDLCIVCARWIT